MIFDNHLHTEFSSDSQMKLEEALAKAASLGIGLVTTEHLDYDYVQTKYYTEEMNFRFDPEEYWRKYWPYRGRGLWLGVELGLSDFSLEYNKDFIGQVPFDQVIGSLHNIDSMDLYYPDYYEGKDKATAYARYLGDMAEQIRKNPYIDILGHIDYICRYAPYADKHICYEELREAVDQVLQAALDTYTVMELNTRRLGDPQAVEALLPIYRRYKEMGGRYISLGSDAHVVENIGMNFKVALDMVDELGLQPVTFQGRRIKYC